MASHTNEIILSLTIGGAFLWLWKNYKKDLHYQYIQNLVNGYPLTFDKIKILSQEDLDTLLSISSIERAYEISTKIKEYKEQTMYELEEQVRLADIERERIRIEENRKKQLQLMEMANKFDINAIKYLNDQDFDEIVKYLDTAKISTAIAVRLSYESELHIKRKINELHAETERLKIERERLRYEREQDMNRKALLTRDFEYQNGFDRGLIDGINDNHAANGWDWFFTSVEFKQGYEIGYKRARRELNVDTQESRNVSREISKNLIREVDKLSEKVDKLGEDLNDKIVKQKDQEVKKKEDQSFEKIETQLTLLDMMLHG